MSKNSAFDTSDTVVFKGKVTGVTRVSKKAKGMFAIGFFLLMLFLIFAIFSMDGSNDQAKPDAAKSEDEAKAKAKEMEPAKPDSITKNQGDGNALATPGSEKSVFPVGGTQAPAAPAASNVPIVPTVPGKTAASAVPAVPSPGGANATADVVVPSAAGVKPAPPSPSPAEIRASRLAEQREDTRLKAISGGLEVGAGSGWDKGATPAASAAGGQFLASAQGSMPPGSGGAFTAPRPQGQEQDDQNKQLRKASFLRDAEGKVGQYYLKETKQSPLGKYELKMGWKIPAMLIDGIDSDLPGQTCAQVRENVFDSATGKYLLIPQGTKVCGSYDSQVAVGQTRLLMVWNRLVFEDGSTLNLQGMPGTDQAGYAGFDAEVDNHYVKVFTSAGMLSLFSAGVQLSQPKQSGNTNAAPTTGQIAAGALGQQLGQVGIGMIQQQLKIQPTLKQKPGYRFNIQLTRDITFPKPYNS